MKLSPFVWAVALSLPLYAASVFDYGIASKGPLRISGLLLDGVNVSPESNVYIESLNCDTALELRNVRLGGNVKIVNPQASVFLVEGVTSIGGETGQDAIDHHVQFGVPMLMFPYPDTSRFIQYLSGETLTDPYPCGGSYRNIRIAAGTNPHFAGSVQLKGIIYIEQPNNVSFWGHMDITGIIVAAGDPLDNSGANTIDFAGTITSHSITGLDATFDSRLKNEQGTFLIAPGFKASFGQAFDCLYGCIAANGIRFYGLAGGVIGGNILNYSDELMRIEGFELYLNSFSLADAPSGFEAPILKLCSANGGEELTSGDKYLIRWFGNVNVSSVVVEYSLDNGLNWHHVEPPNSGNTGLYHWVVPPADSNDCLVRISSLDHPSITDISDATFSISPPYTCSVYLPMDFNSDCKVDLLDFVVFVEHWLECHREPIEACSQ